MELDKNAKGWLRFLNEMIICAIYIFSPFNTFFFWQEWLSRTNMMILLLGIRDLEFEILSIYAREKIQTNIKRC